MKETTLTCGCDVTCPNAAAGPRLHRRGVLGLLVIGAGLLLLPARAWARKVAVKLDAVAPLKRVGGFVIAAIKGQEILLIRDSGSTVRAVTPLCSHQRYRLTYDAKARQIVCPNHGSRFDLQGRVLKGPARQALSRVYPATLDLPKQRVVLKLD
jgi:nitrite reductase/ring-hydroxylating ferredoxin subunit